MASTRTRADITSADTKQLGFEYQYLYFIVRLLNLRAGGEVGYEAHDDVHVISDSTGITQYIQIKHTTDLAADGNPSNLTALSEDLWKTLSNWSSLITDPTEQRENTSAQKAFIQGSQFILATNRKIAQNCVLDLINSVKNKKLSGAAAKKDLLGLTETTKSAAIQAYIDSVCKLSPSILRAFFEKIEFISTKEDLFDDIRNGIRDKMIAEADINDVLSRLYTQLKEDFFQTAKNKRHQIITYNEWQKKYQPIFNSTRTTLLPLREYQPPLPDHLEQQPFAKELIEIEAVDAGSDGLAELAEFTEHYLSIRMQLLDWHDEGKIDSTTVQRFHDNAFAHWKRIHKKCHRSTKDNLTLDRSNALACFDQTMEKELRIMATDRGLPLSNGEFIFLANEEKIGWKYRWHQ